MTETNFSYMEVSAKRKKRNQLISVLIISAIVMMGVIVWGWIELQKNRNAERIKNALNSQVEPGFREPETAAETPGLEALPETSTVVIQDEPKAVVEPAKPVEPPKPVAQPAPKPVPVAPKTEPRKETVKAKDLPKEPEWKAPREEPVAAAPVTPKPKPVETPKPPEPAVKEEPPVVAMAKPATPVQPAVPTPKPAEAPRAQESPAKVFPPEDLPIPEKPESSEDARQAMAAPPRQEAPAAEPALTGSNTFKTGMSAYKQQDYVNAIRNFAAVPKPATKKRGSLDRDEYVQANFLRGVSLLKVGHMSEAITAFQNVLEYEKYYPLANMNLGICYVELKQYAKANQAFEAVVRDQSKIESGQFDDVMQRTKYFWALAWTRLCKNSTNPDKQSFYRQQAILKWKDYQVWYSKSDKYKSENLKAENYLKSLSPL